MIAITLAIIPKSLTSLDDNFLASESMGLKIEILITDKIAKTILTEILPLEIIYLVVKNAVAIIMVERIIHESGDFI